MALFNFFKKDIKIDTPLNTAVFTTKKIMQENVLITRVYRSIDNSFQFLDDYSSNSNKNIMLVSLGEVLKRDSSIKFIINMPGGHCAHRKNIADKWTIEPYQEEDD